jgi:hypothetical protein
MYTHDLTQPSQQFSQTKTEMKCNVLIQFHFPYIFTMKRVYRMREFGRIQREVNKTHASILFSLLKIAHM